MKVKVSTLVTAVSILQAIDNSAMKLSTSYKVRKILDISQEAIMEFEEKRVKLAETYGTLNESGTQYEFADQAAKDEFQASLNSMLEDEMDLDIVKIPLDMVDDYITIAPVNIPYVEWFISGLTDG
jgi:hypothetical protein